MSAVEEYRKRTETYIEMRGDLKLADAAIAELEAELAALKYQLDLACVDISVYLGYLREYDKDGRSGSSDAVHADLERRWAERGPG